MYSVEMWIAYLAEKIIRGVIETSKKKCPGCRSKFHSPLLHLHEQQSLLDKLQAYFEEVRGHTITLIPKLYESFQAKLIHSEDRAKDAACYIDSARHFLLHSTACSIYYGRYMNEFVDAQIHEEFKRGNRKRKLTNPPDSELLDQIIKQVLV